MMLTLDASRLGNRGRSLPPRTRRISVQALFGSDQGSLSSAPTVSGAEQKGRMKGSRRSRQEQSAIQERPVSPPLVGALPAIRGAWPWQQGRRQESQLSFPTRLPQDSSTLALGAASGVLATAASAVLARFLIGRQLGTGQQLSPAGRAAAIVFGLSLREAEAVRSAGAQETALLRGALASSSGEQDRLTQLARQLKSENLRLEGQASEYQRKRQQAEEEMERLRQAAFPPPPHVSSPRVTSRCSRAAGRMLQGWQPR